MENFEEVLNKAIKRCEGYCTGSNFDRIYSFTTENIFGYLKYFDLENKKTLTVGSSGDQVLNMFYKGCKDITLIDINSFSKFYLYLKISAILSLSYTEFKSFFFINGNTSYYNNEFFSKETFNKIKVTLRMLDYESYLFFDELFTLFESKTIKQYLLDCDEFRNRVICEYNLYLKNRNTYYKIRDLFKKELYNFNLTYINKDIFEFDSNDKYDNIFLSNLASYCGIDKLKLLLDKLNNNLNVNGKMLICYLWDIDFNDNFYKEDWNEMYKLPIVKEKLKEYITEHYAIKDDRTIIHGGNKKRDLILVYKKN